MYVWNILEEKSLSECCILNSDPHLILKSHRSIVNQCRFNSRFHLLASSGIEKILKIWSPYSLPGSTGGGLFGLEEEFPIAREPIEDISTNLASIRDRDASNTVETIEEDRMVIAYFDSQVKRAMQRKETETAGGGSEKNSKIRRASFGESMLATESDSSISLNQSDDGSSNSDDERGSKKASKNSTVIEYGSTPSLTSSSDQSDVENCDKPRTSKQRKSVRSIRNKLRNLRHRCSLNLTEETDYINVLDSLKVDRSISAGENETQNTEMTSLQAKLPDLHTSIEIVDKSMSEIGDCEESQTVVPFEMNTIRFGASSLSSIKSLNEQKRKIELNSLEENLDKDNTNLTQETDISDSKDVDFKFKKRKTNEKKDRYRKNSS